MKAAFSRQEKITMQNIVDACLDLTFEAPESDTPLPEEMRKRIAYHEAGHAIAAEILAPGTVSIASIRKTEGGDYGFVRYSRNDDMEATDSYYYENCLKVSLAGKAASEIVFGESDMGAESDIRGAYRRAEQLVDYRCMYGFQNWITDDHDGFASENRNRVMAMVMEKNYLEVKKVLAEHRDLLDKMAAELMNRTTLLYTDIQKICCNAR